MKISRSLPRLSAACHQQQYATIGGLFQHAAAQYITHSIPLCCFASSSVIQVLQNIRLYHSRSRSFSHSITSIAAKAAATKTPPLLQRGRRQRQGQGFQYLRLDSRTSSFHSSSHLANHTDTICEPSTSDFTMADDRNILPDYFKAVHYDLSLTDLDFTSWTFNGSVTYEMNPSLLEPASGVYQANTRSTASLATSQSPPKRLPLMPWS